MLTGMEFCIADVASPAQLAQCHGIRLHVFVREQGVDEALELDGRDAACSHVLALRAGHPVGTARARPTANGTKLERVAVLPQARGCGVGAAMVEHLLERLPADQPCYVHSQQSATAFWAAMGFSPVGAPFEEAGILHRLMRRPAATGLEQP